MDEEEKDKERELDKFKNRSWRKKKRSKRNTTDLECLRKIKESGATPKITGVLFVPHTEKSELAKRIREKLKVMESISSLRVKVVERTGGKIVELLHKSNPWESSDCNREKCKFCITEENVGKCKQRCIVYETQCLICKEGKPEEKESMLLDGISMMLEKDSQTGEKRNMH